MSFANFYRTPALPNIAEEKQLLPAIKEVFLEFFTKFTGKHLYQSLFLIKLQALGLQFIRKKTVAHVFFCEFYEVFKSAFSIEHLRATASSKQF